MKRQHGGKALITGILAATCALLVLLAVPAIQPGPTDTDAAAPQSSEPSAVPPNNASSRHDGETVAADVDAPADASNPFGDAEHEPGVALVMFAGSLDPADALTAIIAETGLDGLTIQDQGPDYALLALPAGVPDEEALSLIGASSAVESVQPNFVYTLQDDVLLPTSGALAPTQLIPTPLSDQADATDESFNTQWALPSMHVPEAWDLVPDGRHVGVAVIDEGFNLEHEDLPIPAGIYNSVNQSADVSPTTPAQSSVITIGHGTHVAGIIGATTNNGKGIAGVSRNVADLVLIKAFGNVRTTSGVQYSATSTTLIAAYDYVFQKAAACNIRVVNMSVGMTKTALSQNDNALYGRIKTARDDYNIVTVCSGGNAGNTSYNFPGDCADAVSVINLTRVSDGKNGWKTNDDGTLQVSRNSNASYNSSSNTAASGEGKNISAPGTSVFSTWWSADSNVDNTRSYASMSGSSMAAPQVAGVFALLFARYPNLSAAEATTRIYNSATDLGAAGWDAQYGHGEVNALAAMTQGTASLSTAVVTWPATYVYTGYEQKPTPTVTVGGVPLTAGADFTVSYPSDCVGVGNKAVTITAAPGSSTYYGSTTSSYSIAQAPLSAATVTLSPASYTYDGSAKRPAVTARLGSHTLVEGADYTVSYSGNVNAGTATATLTGKGGMQGTKAATFRIGSAPLSGATVSVSPASYTYDGKAKEPAVTVRVGSTTLRAGADYEVSYSNNTNVGTATAIVTGRGNYAGSKSATFSIAAAPVTVYRVYHTTDGEHFYTTSRQERDQILSWGGWNDEGVAWVVPSTSSAPVYRLYDTWTGEHHYTASAEERAIVLSWGHWNDEGIAWYSDDAQTMPVHRLQNSSNYPHAHHYTLSANERSRCINEWGWRSEGVGWYALAAG